jgi:hypothetical protein
VKREIDCRTNGSTGSPINPAPGEPQRYVRRKRKKNNKEPKAYCIIRKVMDGSGHDANVRSRRPLAAKMETKIGGKE